MPERECWRVADLLIDVGRQRVERDGVEIPLAAVTFRFLLALVRAAPNVLSLDQLMDMVWTGLVVSPETVTQRAKLLREALDDSAKEPRYVRALRSRGYVLVADAVRVEAPGPVPVEEPAVAAPLPAPPQPSSQPEAPPRPRRRSWGWLALAVLVAAAVATAARLLSTPTPPTPVRLAVLPIASVGSTDDAYLASGLTSEVSGTLAKVPGVRIVIVEPAAGLRTDQAPDELGRRLGVGYLLKGGLQKVQDSMRVDAQLVRAEDGTVQWAGSLSEDVKGLGRLRDQLVAATLAALKLPTVTARTDEVPGEAHRLFMLANFLTQRTSRDGFDQALKLYDQALALAPDYAAAWEGKARVYQFMASLGWIPATEGFARAREMAARALAADPDFGLAHTRLGAIDLGTGDFASAARHIHRGYELDPGDQLNLGNASILLRSMGRVAEARLLSRRADLISPLNPRGMLAGGVTALAAGKFADASTNFRSTLALSPGFQSAGFYLAVSLLLSGDGDGAGNALAQETSVPLRLRGQALLAHRLHHDVGADEALKELERLYDAGEANAYGLAAAHAAAGRVDDAFAWLDRAAAAAYDSELPLLLIDPLFAGLHGDPRWAQLRKRLGRSPEALAAIPFELSDADRTVR